MKSFGIYLAALFAGAALATGCYEDKGNYDYTTTGDDIVVYRLDTMKSVRLSWSYDEEIVIEPGYRIVHDRVSEGVTNGTSTGRRSPRIASCRSTRCRSDGIRAALRSSMLTVRSVTVRFSP